MRLGKKILNPFINAWTVWIVAAIFCMFQFVLQSFPSVMIPELMSTFSINVINVGFLTSTFFYCYFILQIPSGILADKWGSKKLLLISVLIITLACLGFAVSHTFTQAVLTRTIMGLAAGPAIVCALALARHWFPIHLFSLVLGLTEMLALMGGGVGQITTAYGTAFLGWRTTIFIYGLFGFILIWAIIAIVHNYPPHVPARPPYRTWRMLLKNLSHVLKLPQIWINGIYASLLFTLLAAFAALWAVPYLIERFDIPVTKAGSIAAMFFFGSSVGCPLYGWISQKLQLRKPPMIISPLLSIIFFLIVIYTDWIDLDWMWLAFFLFGVSICGYILPYAVIGESLPKSVGGLAMGVANGMAIALGAPLFQPIIGIILKFHANINSNSTLESYSVIDYKHAFVLFLIALIISLILSFFIKETRCQETNISKIEDIS